MFNYNKLWFGLVIGLLVPFVGYAILLEFYDVLERLGWVSTSGFSAGFRQRTAAIAAIALNAILLNLYQKRRFFENTRGISIVTALYAIAWFIYFGKSLL